MAGRTTERRWRLGLMVVACLAAVGWAAGAASVASAAVIGFDDLQDGVTVQNQYASQGVVFDNAGDLPVVRAVGAGPAESPPNVADISVCSACEFFRPYTTGHFSDGATRQHVSVRVGEFPTTAPDTAVVQLIAYDTGHAVVAQSSPATVSAGAGFHTLLSADSANADIYSFEITARANLDASKPIGIDNLTLDNPSARTPDFALGAAAGVKVLAGSSVGVPISIDRLNGSAGNVQLGVAGLPQGVSSSISPSPAPGSSATLTLTAASDAPRSVVGATITGTPAGTSVGPGAHSRQLSIGVERPFTVRVPPNTVADLSNCRLQVPVSLSRDFSFPGPVDLAVGGLPSGVSASFVPAQATFPAGAAGETVMLTLTAPPDVGVTQGPAVVTVTGTSPGRPPSSTSFAVSGACPRIHVQSIEVTQGIQAFGLPEAGNLPFTPATGARGASYTAESAKHVNQLGDGYARLQAGGKTVVRVYAATALSGTTSPARNITAMLHAYDSDTGAPLYANSLYPDQGPNLGARDLRQGADQPTDAQRADPNGAFTFTLPDGWTRRVTYGPFGRTIGHSRSITIRADLLRLNGGPDAVATPDCTSDACQAGSSFALSDIPFESTDTVAYAIAPIAMTSGNAMPPPPPSPVDLFRDAQNFTPLDMTVYPNYLATVDVSDIAARGLDSTAAGHAVLDRVDGFDEHNDTAGYSYGVNEIGARGMEHSYWNYGRAQVRSDAEIADGSNSATGFAHEWFHLLGLPHAGCGDVGENLGPWPPDQMGFIQGVGLDRQTDSGGKGRYRIYFPTASAAIFDFMSYCAGTPWISLHYWNQLIAEHSTGPQARGARARAGSALGSSVQAKHLPRAAESGARPLLSVTGLVTNAGVRILDARPLDRGTPPPGQSEFHLTALDAGGHVLYDAPMFAETPHIDHGEPGVMLHGLLPRGGVAVIEITRNGAVVAKRVRGAAPARLRLLSPLSGSATGRRPTVAIGWRASGPGASDSGLEATVEYSTDNGRSWRTLFIGPDRGHVDLPNRYFAKSSQARVRVRVSNGFTDSTTTSGRFSALGSPPTVRITSPGRNERMTDDAPLYLSGIAFDDALAQLHGRRLRWYADRQLLGTGEKITATGIPPGTRRIRLVARDSNGRAAEAFVPIAIRGSKPLFIALGSPKKLSRRARGLTLRAASDIPATLTIGRAHFPVNSVTRSIKQRVRPGKGTLVLRLRLTSYGKSTTLALRMTRPQAAVR